MTENSSEQRDGFEDALAGFAAAIQGDGNPAEWADRLRAARVPPATDAELEEALRELEEIATCLELQKDYSDTTSIDRGLIYRRIREMFAQLRAERDDFERRIRNVRRQRDAVVGQLEDDGDGS
jgi:hypothetical protein